MERSHHYNVLSACCALLKAPALPCHPWHLLRDAILLVVVLQASHPAAAREISTTCLAPIAPSLALPDATLLEYRAELIIEFEAYFRDSSLYIACLDAERARSMEEAHVTAELFAKFLSLTPFAENTSTIDK